MRLSLNTIIDSLLDALRALVNPRLWLDLLRALLSRRGLAVVLLLAIGLVVVVASAFLLQGWSWWIPMIVWLHWLVPAAARLLGPVVARHVVGPMVETRDAPPADVHEREPPEPRVYRHWWATPLVTLFVLVLLYSRIKWQLGSLGHAALVLTIAVVTTRFVVLSSLCTWFPLPTIEQSLRTRRLSWHLLLSIVGLGMSGIDALLGAVIGQPGQGSIASGLKGALSGRTLLTLTIDVLLTVAVSALTTSLAASRLLRDTSTVAKVRTTAKPRARWTLAAWAAGLVGTLALSWLVLGRQYACWILSFDADFRQMVGHVSADNEYSLHMARSEMACKDKHFAVRLLHAAGVRQGAEDQNRGLACAIHMRRPEMVRLLIRLGDDVNRLAYMRAPFVDPVPVSLLAHALQERQFDMAELLLANGARLENASVGGPTAVHLAAARRCIPCMEWLGRHGAKLDLPGYIAPLALWFDSQSTEAAEDVPTLERLVALGLSPTATGADGRSALHAAAHRGNRAAVEWLLARGAAPAVPDQAGMTPLMHAGHPYQIPAEARDVRGVLVNGKPPVPAPLDQQERLAIVLGLLQHTPSLAGEARRPPPLPAHPIRGTPEIDPGWSLALLAAREPAFRHAAREQGKAIDYGVAPKGVNPWSKLKPELVRTALQDMTDDEFRSALWNRDKSTGQRQDSVPFLIVRHGWNLELERALRLGLVHSAQAGEENLCRLLAEAAGGADDGSPERVDSWQGVLMLLDAGLQPQRCTQQATDLLRRNLSRRVPVQSAQWAVRAGGSGTAGESAVLR